MSPPIIGGSVALLPTLFRVVSFITKTPGQIRPDRAQPRALRYRSVPGPTAKAMTPETAKIDNLQALPAAEAQIRRGSALEVLRAFLRLGLTSFGGPVAHLGYFRGEFVERRRWLDEPAFADIVALANFCPAPPAARSGSASGSCVPDSREALPPGSALPRLPPWRWSCSPMA